MQAKPFQLINAHAGDDIGSSEIEILRDRASVEDSHVQFSSILFDAEDRAGPGYAEGRGQTMRPARERGERMCGLSEIARLMQETVFERQCLICAQAVGFRMQCAGGERLGLC